MGYGYMGKILFVNLSTRKIEEEELSEEICRHFIGGYGLGVRIIYERQKAQVDPLGEENILAFITGPFNGAGVPAGGRYMVAGKSPLTGTWGDANSGGFFGPELKATGYDAIFFIGQAENPVYLWLNDGKAELKDAQHLWGKDTVQTEDLIKKELKDLRIQVACIGPAGETLSLISGIVTDKGRVAARSGLGALMGSKRLKAIAVRGSKKVSLADKVKVAELRRAFGQRLRRENIPFYKVLSKYGTAGNVETNTTTGACPIKNWSLSGIESFPTVFKISDDDVIKYEIKKYSCAQCPIACGGIMRVEKGPFAVGEVHKVEYETLAAFGTMCLNDNPESIIKANDICNRYGLDTISAGATIAFAMECYENGLITKEDTGGIELIWGNSQALVEILENMVKREGFGEILADGAKVAAEKIGKGAEQYAMQVHGQEVGFHNPLFTPSRAIAYLFDPTPGRHTAGSAGMAEAGRANSPHPNLELPKIERYKRENKGKVQAIWSNYVQVVNCSGLCQMPFFFGAFPLAEFISAVTGWNYSLDEVLITGERIQTLRHCFNVREGLKPSDFKIPGRLIGKPSRTKGLFAGITIDLDPLGQDYFKTMGWDYATGRPSRERLEKLGLAELTKDILLH